MSDKPIFEQRIEGEVNFGGKDIIERLHGPEIIQQLQQENQALKRERNVLGPQLESFKQSVRDLEQENQILRDNLRLAHARLDNTLKDWPADTKDSTIEAQDSIINSLRDELCKSRDCYNKVWEEKTRLREALKDLLAACPHEAEGEQRAMAALKAREALAPQGTETH